MIVKSTIEQYYTHAHTHISVYFTAHTLNILTLPKFFQLPQHYIIPVIKVSRVYQ